MRDMEKGKIKLTYIGPQKRVRCEFSKQDCLDHALPPDDIIERTQAKLHSEKAAGEIAFVRIFKTRLLAIWQILRDSNEPLDTKVAVTIGSGAPAMPGLVITEGRSADELGRISIEATREEALTWKPYFLKLTIGHRLKAFGESRPTNPAQITRIWIRALAGIPVIDIPLIPIPAAFNAKGQNPIYEIIEEEQCRDITLIVHDVHAVAQPEIWEEVKREIWARIDARNLQRTGSYHFLYDDLIRSLRSGERGPEHFGLDMPMVLLAAIDNKYYRNAAHLLQASDEQALGIAKSADQDSQRKASVQNESSSRRTNATTGQPLKSEEALTLVVTVSPDKMEAVIGGFGVFGDRPQPAGTTIDSVKTRLAKYKFAPTATAISLDAIEKKLSAAPGANSIIAMTIALGIRPTIGKDPYLRMVPSSGSQKLSSGQIFDVRTSQRQAFVHKGDLLAEVAYKFPGIQGMDIYGTLLHAIEETKLTITNGEGVEERSPGKFYATVDGQPQQDGQKLTVIKGLVHDGDVNLVSGNITFAGAVQIGGSVEAGATVEVTGNLSVLGSIGASYVYCQENLAVEGGINTGPKGLVKVRGLLTAKFIENSQISCGADIVITDAITNSTVSAVGNCTATTIIGSEFHLSGNLICEILGKEGAKSTIVHLGGGKRAHVRIQICTGRIAHFTASHDEMIKQVGVLEHKTDLQKTPKHRAAAEGLRVRATRLQDLIVKLQAKLEETKNNQVLSEKGTVRITGALTAGTIIHIGRHKIRTVDTVAEVCVSYAHATGIVVSALEPESEILGGSDKNGIKV
jgi:uncharacterized protein (DUF342 family)